MRTNVFQKLSRARRAMPAMRSLALCLLSMALCAPAHLRAGAPFDAAGFLTPSAYDRMLLERERGGLVQPPAAAERALRRAAVAASMVAASKAGLGREGLGSDTLFGGGGGETSMSSARFAAAETETPPSPPASSDVGAAPALLKKASDVAVSAGSFLLGRLKSDAGSVKASLDRTMTDFEMCQGCQVTIARVLEHSTESTMRDEIRFALHSACHNQPPVLDEACDWLMQQDSLLADLLLRPGARGPRWSEPCHAVGLCTLSDLANTRALPAAAATSAKAATAMRRLAA